jgi:hypothetical protein
VWPQHNGALPHCGRAEKDFLDEDCEGRWIEGDGPVPWPALSNDLNLLYFFLWDCMKFRVYHGSKPEARHQLVETIDKAAVGIRNELEGMQWQHSMAQRFAARMESNSGHFKHVVITLKLRCFKHLR